MEWARLEGPLAAGSRIRMKPKGSRETVCTISEVAPLRAFRTEARLPLCRLRVDHEMWQRPGGTEFRHRLTMTGLFPPLFRRLFANHLAESLPDVLAAIATHAEHADAG